MGHKANVPCIFKKTGEKATVIEVWFKAKYQSQDRTLYTIRRADGTKTIVSKDDIEFI